MCPVELYRYEVRRGRIMLSLIYTGYYNDLCTSYNRYARIGQDTEDDPGDRDAQRSIRLCDEPDQPHRRAHPGPLAADVGGWDEPDDPRDPWRDRTGLWPRALPDRGRCPSPSA